MQTIISPLVHSENEHAIVHLLSPNAKEHAVDIQAELVKIFGSDIWLQQPSNLHMTLMEVINDTAYEALSRRQHFEQWYQKYSQVTRDVITQVTPFTVPFTELLVSQRAIILKAANSDQFNNLRASILAKTDLPSGTKLPPTITHCTVARFTQAIEVERVARLTKDIVVNFIERVEDFSLVKDLGPPDFNDMPLEIYKLKG